MKFTKLRSLTGFERYVFSSDDTDQFKTCLEAEGFFLLPKSIFQGKKAFLRFCVNKTSKEVFTIWKTKGHFEVMGSGLNLPTSEELASISPFEKDAKNIFIRRAVVATYTKWLQHELDYEAVLGGFVESSMGAIECPWF